MATVNSIVDLWNTFTNKGAVDPGPTYATNSGSAQALQLQAYQAQLTAQQQALAQQQYATTSVTLSAASMPYTYSRDETFEELKKDLKEFMQNLISEALKDIKKDIKKAMVRENPYIHSFDVK